jgi:hypothetical protein
VISSERLYPIRRPVAAACAGAAVALLAGLIGLGGAEFRLPILIGIFALYPHSGIRINLLISFVALAASAVSRVSFLQAANLPDHLVETLGMLGGGVMENLRTDQKSVWGKLGISQTVVEVRRSFRSPLSAALLAIFETRTILPCSQIRRPVWTGRRFRPH